jgi:hypothetical protein
MAAFPAQQFVSDKSSGLPPVVGATAGDITGDRQWSWPLRSAEALSWISRHQISNCS